MKKIKRLVKLGFFVGLGTATAVIAACGSTVSQHLDTSIPDGPKVDKSGVADKGSPEAGSKDMGPPDAGSKDKAPADKRGWDIPLE